MKKDLIISFKQVAPDEGGVYVAMRIESEKFNCTFFDYRSVDFLDFVFQCFDYDVNLGTNLLVYVPRSGFIRCQLFNYNHGDSNWSDFQSFDRIVNSYYNLEKNELRQVNCIDLFEECDVIRFFKFIVNHRQYKDLFKYNNNLPSGRIC